jgi:hypothetical protein
MLKPIYENIPEELKDLRQWVNWKSIIREEGDKPTKPPYHPNGKLAATNNSETWCHFLPVKAAAKQFDGVGFVLTKDDPFVGLDFDNCRCLAFDGIDDEISGGLNMVLPHVADHIRKLNSYTEVSPSGKGIRIFLKGNLPVDGKRKGTIEAYQSGRYVTITGHTVDGFPRTIEPRQMEVDAFFNAVFGTLEKPIEREKKTRTETLTGDWKELLERAFKSKNGTEIQGLYSGDHTSYPSQSEADLALCSRLAFWFNGDAAAIDSALRASGLYRDKWNEKHSGDGRTYGEATIQKAISGCTSFYGDKQSHVESPKETALHELWPELLPFNDYSNLPDFPVDALPGVCGSMVQAVADSCQVDAGLPGSMMLAVLSTAIGSRAKIILDSHIEQGNLYLIPVLGSGNRKSESNSQLTSPLYTYQKARQEAMMPIIKDAENNMRILEKRLERLEKGAAREDNRIERENVIRECRALQREIEENPVPNKPIYLVDDITPERLGGIMADNEERVAILSAEGGFFKIIAGLYSKGTTANLDLILKSHTGDAWASDRVSRESKSMEHPALTLGLAVQPDVIEEIGRNSEFRGRGLSARFLYSLCKSRAGYRTLQTSPVPANVKESYNRLILSLMAVEGKHELRMSPDAQAVWNGFSDDVEALLRPGAQLDNLVDWGSKLAGAVARIAGLLHYADSAEGFHSNQISKAAIESACVIGAYYIEHAVVVFGLMKEDTRITTAKKILAYIKRHKPETFKGRELFNHTNCQSMQDIQPGLNILVEWGYIRESVKQEIGSRPGRPPSSVYEVNPKILSDI